jgi:uncharacterized protein DUF1353
VPFLEQLVPGGPWVLKRDVGFRQLAPRRPGRFDGRVWFEVLETFRYAYPGSPAARGEEEPPPELAVCRGDVTDLASVPPPLWGVIASYGTHTMPALLHDRLCVQAARQPGEGPALRRWADRHFRRMLRDEARAGITTRWAMWSAVRLFSSLPWAGASVLWSGALWASAVQALRGRPVPGAVRGLLWGSSLAVLAAAVVRGFERPLDFGTPCPEPPGEPPAEAAAPVGSAVPPPARYRPAATGSLLGAAGVGALAFPLFAPAVVVNVAVLGVLRLLDLVLAAANEVAAKPVARLLRRRRPPYPGVHDGGPTSPGDEGAAAVLDEPWPAVGSLFPRC